MISTNCSWTKCNWLCIKRAYRADLIWGPRFLVHGPKQVGAVTPGQVLCSEMESVWSYCQAT